MDDGIGATEGKKSVSENLIIKWKGSQYYVLYLSWAPHGLLLLLAVESFIRFSPFIEHYFYVVIEFRVTYTTSKQLPQLSSFIRDHRCGPGRHPQSAHPPIDFVVGHWLHLLRIGRRGSGTRAHEDSWVLRKFQFATLFAVPLSFSAII